MQLFKIRAFLQNLPGRGDSIEHQGFRFLGPYLGKTFYRPCGVIFDDIFGTPPAGTDKRRFFAIFGSIAQSFLSHMEERIKAFNKQFGLGAYLVVVNGRGKRKGVTGVNKRKKRGDVVILYAYLRFPALSGRACLAGETALFPHGEYRHVTVRQIGSQGRGNDVRIPSPAGTCTDKQDFFHVLAPQS